jgi:hypothetical protein
MRNFSTFVLFILRPDSDQKDAKTGNCVAYTVQVEFTVFSVIIELSHLPLLKFALMLSVISKAMVTCWMAEW